MQGTKVSFWDNGSDIYHIADFCLDIGGLNDGK
jgi:hypothetical protein